jgi:hypothetical protein
MSDGASARLSSRDAIAADFEILDTVAADLEAAATTFCRRNSDEALGIAFYRREQIADALRILSIVIHPELRGWGYGSEAVGLLERDNPAARFIARVDPADGLNLYFWLRLGYRPERSVEDVLVGRGDGMITMVRESTG